MVSTFLHEDKTQPPDDLAADEAPRCVQCDEEMWLTKVVKSITDSGSEGVYTYECKVCGARQKITRHAERVGALPVAPEV